MISNVNSLYEQIANAVVEELPIGWQNATITAIFYSDGISWEPEFRTASGKLCSFDVSLALTRAFRELRRRFKDEGKPVWGQASFELNSDFSFSIKWGYDACDQNGDTIWNEKDWQCRQEEREKRLS